MKVSVNGGLNCSILDGWWVEGYDGDNGFAIGSGEEYADLGYQDEVESRLLYELIERDITPLFYERDAEGLPRAWIRRMKRAIATQVPVFNTNRMVEEYYKSCYLPSHGRYRKLTGDHLQGAKELSRWRRDLLGSWDQVQVLEVTGPTGELLRVGAEFTVQVRVRLGSLRPQDVSVQLVMGLLDATGELTATSESVPLQVQTSEASSALFTGAIRCKNSGQYGYTVRVLPQHPLLPHSFEPMVATYG
jgi:starch phosphorylase